VRRRYCDNAATTWPKPEAVWEAWSAAARDCGASAGRGGYRSALAAGRLREAARGAAARLLGTSPGRVALVPSATIGLNMAIQGLVEPGDHLIVTAADHNATLRPVHALERAGRIGCSVVPCDATGQVAVAAILEAVRPSTRWIVLAHASNVTGAVQDVRGLAEGLADRKPRRPRIILDAAQTAGVLPLDVGSLGADVVVAPAHKWILGMAGVAAVWAADGVEPRSVLQGGTGTASEALDMPEAFVQRLEPGTPDTPALAAMSAAVDWLERAGVERVASGCRVLAAACVDGLREIEGVRVFNAAGGPPIVAFTVEGYHPAEVAGVLEQAAAVEVRSGLHCAGLVHGHLGAPDGTVRASFGPFNTPDDAREIVGIVRQLAESRFPGAVSAHDGDSTHDGETRKA
jgi:cysteine desulfurase/selenocysteine lyase